MRVPKAQLQLMLRVPATLHELSARREACALMWRGRAVQSDGNEIIVAGLGNPGAQYAGTRHNIGQDVVDAFAAKHGANWQDMRKFRARVATFRLAGQRWVLAVPNTFMNVSGVAVQAVAAFYKVQPQQLIVCHDDLDVDLGQLRVKRGGGHGGHNGLKDIDRAFGTSEYLRLRIGIGRPPLRMDPSKFVLARFGSQERDVVDGAMARSLEALVALTTDGLDATQNRFHSRP